MSYLFSLSVAGPYKTAFFGSNVTFNCSAAGLPKPNITWVKNNNSNAANSKLKNYCVKKSSAGEIASKYTFLFIKQLGEVAHWYSL